MTGTFGGVVACVVVREADFGCFAQIVTKLHGHEAEALLYRPCALAKAPTRLEALGGVADECFELSSLGGPEAPAGVAAAGAANEGASGERAAGAPSSAGQGAR